MLDCQWSHPPSSILSLVTVIEMSQNIESLHFIIYLAFISWKFSTRFPVFIISKLVRQWSWSDVILVPVSSICYPTTPVFPVFSGPDTPGPWTLHLSYHHLPVTIQTLSTNNFLVLCGVDIYYNCLLSFFCQKNRRFLIHDPEFKTIWFNYKLSKVWIVCESL